MLDTCYNVMKPDSGRKSVFFCWQTKEFTCILFSCRGRYHFDGFTVQVVCLVFNINLWLFELYFGLFNTNFRLLSSSFNRKFDSVRNHILVSSWSLQDNFCADQLGIEHRLFPDCQPTCIFWIGQIRILHLVVLP